MTREVDPNVLESMLKASPSAYKAQPGDEGTYADNEINHPEPRSERWLLELDNERYWERQQGLGGGNVATSATQDALLDRITLGTLPAKARDEHLAKGLTAVIGVDGRVHAVPKGTTLAQAPQQPVNLAKPQQTFEEEAAAAVAEARAAGLYVPLGDDPDVAFGYGSGDPAREMTRGW